MSAVPTLSFKRLRNARCHHRSDARRQSPGVQPKRALKRRGEVRQIGKSPIECDGPDRAPRQRRVLQIPRRAVQPLLHHMAGERRAPSREQPVHIALADADGSRDPRRPAGRGSRSRAAITRRSASSVASASDRVSATPARPRPRQAERDHLQQHAEQPCIVLLRGRGRHSVQRAGRLDDQMSEEGVVGYPGGGDIKSCRQASAQRPRPAPRTKPPAAARRRRDAAKTAARCRRFQPGHATG